MTKTFHRRNPISPDHAIRVLPPLMALVIPVVQTLASPPSHIVAATLTMIQCAVILNVIDHPLFCLSILTAIDATTSLHTGGNVPSAFLPALLALGYICYRYDLLVGALSTAIICLVESMGRFWHITAVPGDRDLVYTLLVVMMIACCGRMFRQQERQLRDMQEQRLSEWRIRSQRHDERLANALHDAVTGDLSLIARTAQRHIEIQPNGVIESWTSVNQWAMHALDEIHHLIDHLDRQSCPRVVRIPGCSISDMQLALQYESEQLAELGLTGHANVRMLERARAVNPQDMTFITDLSKEILVNIARHATANSKYELSVLITDAAAEITEINVTDERSEMLFKGGHGLAHYGRLVEQRGGTFTYSVHGNLWTLYVYYPL